MLSAECEFMRVFREVKLSPQHSKLSTAIWWVVVAALVTALGLRFAMRAVGVRGDVPFPGVVYSVTAPLVAPFYGLFPLGDARFDHPVIEVASLVAAGVIVAIALVVSKFTPRGLAPPTPLLALSRAA